MAALLLKPELLNVLSVFDEELPSSSLPCAESPSLPLLLLSRGCHGGELESEAPSDFSAASSPESAGADLRRKAPTYACPLQPSSKISAQLHLSVACSCRELHARPGDVMGATGRHHVSPRAFELKELPHKSGILYRHRHDVAREQWPPWERDSKHLHSTACDCLLK